MVLIISEDTDYSTNEVIDWLCHLEKDFIRINAEEFIEIEALLICNHEIQASISFKGKSIILSDISCVWIRRGSLHFEVNTVQLSSPLAIQVIQHLKDEGYCLSEYLHFHLDKKKSLGSKKARDLNKLVAMEKAIDAGFDVPHTWVIASRKKLEEISALGVKLITKGIDGIARFTVEDTIISNYTEVVKNIDITDSTESFFPSLFQTAIEKAYELRIFYIDEKCYSMAIFSQNDTRTAVDFRKYNFVKPNRLVPYALPEEITNKVIAFMKSVNLNTGSLDILVTKNNEYIFLEVNPEGQFGMTSKPCNYYLEQVIATYLAS